MPAPSRIIVVLGFAVLVALANLAAQRILPTFHGSSLKRRAGYSILVRLGATGLILITVGVASLFGH